MTTPTAVTAAPVRRLRRGTAASHREVRAGVSNRRKDRVATTPLSAATNRFCQRCKA